MRSSISWEKRRSRGWAASAATRSRGSRTPSRSARRSTTGASRARPGSTTATSRSTWRTSRRRTSGDRDGTDPFYQEQVEHETRIGFLYQKLHRPRSYDYLKDKEKYKTWDDRLRMPQFAWANDPAAVEEVMTFILGLTGEKIGSKYLAKANYNEVQTALAKGGKVLNRYNCTGCHVLEMPKFSIPEGTKVAEAFTDFKANVQVLLHGRNNDLHRRDLSPADLRSQEEARCRQHRGRAGLCTKDDGKPVTIEGMPIGLFENELTVQLWKPVTIRGYTFNVGDNVTLDQTKVQKTPAVGGDFAWLFSTYPQERTGTSFESFWNRLPPPLVREGNKVQTPWFALFLRDPYAIRPAAQLRMPRFHYGKAVGSPLAGNGRPGRLLRRPRRRRVPLPDDPPAAGGLRRRARHGASRLPRGRLVDDGEQGLALHPVPRDRPVQADRRGAGCQRPRPAAGVHPVPARASWRSGSPIPSGWSLTRRCRRTWYPTGQPQLPVPKTFENQPIEMVRAIRDTLLNYTNVVEQQLAGRQSPGGPALTARDRRQPPSRLGPPSKKRWDPSPGGLRVWLRGSRFAADMDSSLSVGMPSPARRGRRWAGTVPGPRFCLATSI